MLVGVRGVSKGKKHSPEQVIAKLQQGEKMKAEGATVRSTTEQTMSPASSAAC